MTHNQEKKKGLSIEAYNTKMNLLEVKVEQIERKLSNKADDVVNIQLLQHRRELEDLYSAISKMQASLKLIDEELTALIGEDRERETKPSRRVSRAGKVTPIFS